MAANLTKTVKKIAYDAKVVQLLRQYKQVLVTAADNISSDQLKGIKNGLGNDSVLVLGKNTMMQRAMRVYSEETGNKAFLGLIPLLKGNVGLVFTHRDLKEVSDEIAKYKSGALDRVGVVAPIGVIPPVDISPPGNAWIKPSETDFFQTCYLSSMMPASLLSLCCDFDGASNAQAD